MDGQGQGQGQGNNVPGPNGRRLHIAHRRSPSEITPLMMEQLALQQQIETLQQQQQHLAATHQQYVNMGFLQPQQQLHGYSPSMQGQGQAGGLPGNAFQFPQGQQQQQPQPQPQPQQQQSGGGSPNPSSQPSHRRNQSALPGMGPPPAPSSGAAAYGEYNNNNNNSNNNNQGQGNQNRENASHSRRGGPPGGGHQRRHSLALPEARKAAELAQQKKTTSGFQFPAATPEESKAEEKPPQPAPSASQAPQGLGVQRAGNIRQGGHSRSQSLAVGNGRVPGRFGHGDTGSGDGQRRPGHQGHGRTASRNLDNWRQPNNNQGQEQGQQQPQPPPQQQRAPMGSFGQQQGGGGGGGGFQPGHRARGSVAAQSVSGIGSFQYPNQSPLLQLPQGQFLVSQQQQQQQPQLLGGQQQLNQLNPLQLAQLQALQQQQQGGQVNGQNLGGQPNQGATQQLSAQQQQQQRKTLFTPYLPQANVPALLADGQLVTGILRVNKKNRSDAYVTTNDLDADIFICGSKDRNRALEGDFVAIELLDVDEVWSQKREKEEKKKRKDITDARSGSTAGVDRSSRSESGANGDNQQVAPDGSIRRRGSLRQRPTQKKNDDVEVEGQSLLLVEEDEISDEQKPLYAGHVVAVIERVPGQMFSGSLGLLRPSSQATKEKQEAERQARDGNQSRPHHDRQQDKPKIVWFKPTDKRVPLIAIPTEQAPRDFVEKHQDYANNIFVASIKRWPITSLHPFGTLVEQLGEMGDLKVETDALLRDNNFGADEFSDAVLRNVGFENWTIDSEGDAALAARRDFRDETTFTIDPNGTNDLVDAIHVKDLSDAQVEVGIHVADVAHFVEPNSLVDREAKKRGTGVHLIDRVVNMLPPKLSVELCSLVPGEDRLSVSVVFQVDRKTGFVEGEPWIGKGIIRSSGKLSYDDVDAVIKGNTDVELHGAKAEDIKLLNDISIKFREARFGNRSKNIPALRLLYQLDDENIPVERNIFQSSPAHELIEELSHKANSSIATFIHAALPEKAFLRRQSPPNSRRLQTFFERMTRLGYDIDPSSSGALQNSLINVEDVDIRKGMETLLLKSMRHAKYFVSSTVKEEDRQHYVLNLPLYTHFTSPSRRYADIVVHRQLDFILSKGSGDYPEEVESLVKTADHCNNKKDSAQTAQEQSVHIESCRAMDKLRHEIGGDLISEGIVLSVYESAFDILIPEYGFEKRVHCDQLPLKKAEFRKDSRVLELYWEKGVPSSAYIPEDERPKSFNSRGGAAAAAREAEAREKAREREEAQRKQTDTGTMSTDDVDALFEDDDDSIEDLTEMASGVSLNSPERPTQSMPPSPTRNGPTQQAPHRTQSDPKIARSASEAPENNLSNKEKYFSLFKLREEGGEYIQDVTEMTRVPIILKTDLSKSPPCLTIRSVNPYAL